MGWAFVVLWDRTLEMSLFKFRALEHTVRRGAAARRGARWISGSPYITLTLRYFSRTTAPPAIAIMKDNTRPSVHQGHRSPRDSDTPVHPFIQYIEVYHKDHGTQQPVHPGNQSPSRRTIPGHSFITYIGSIRSIESIL